MHRNDGLIEAHTPYLGTYLGLTYNSEKTTEKCFHKTIVHEARLGKPKRGNLRAVTRIMTMCCSALDEAKNCLILQHLIV